MIGSIIPARPLKKAMALAAAAVLAMGAAVAPPDHYEPTVESLNSHPTPRWFEDAKFGVFIHWGAYSVPAWGPRGSYAEWYWNYLNSSGSATNRHHRDTYGTGFDYDRFVDQWKAEKFDPADWVKLFNDAGAKYFVLTSKHHEGVSLWDSRVSGRDTVELGPKRDLSGELFAAAHRDGKLKTGFYYSLYEWYNPSYTGRPARNPYTGAEIPYTGAPQVADYVGDYMLPQMRELIDGYDPDIIWCDGQWEKPASYWKTAGVIADYYNKALRSGKEVAVANRCKIESGNLDSTELDFQTPEYTVKADIDANKWEASRGIAHSYGYNQNEPESDYLTSDQLVDSLVDIVSKNGNLLLDIGPRADGTIPSLMRERLLDIGDWLKVNGEAIYGTTYWNHAEEKGGGDDVRYTVKDGALYATALAWPGEELTLGADVPADHSTRVTLLGSDGAPLAWHRDGQGRFVVKTPQEQGRHAYVFKITTPGVNTLLRASTDLPDEIAEGRTVTGTLTLTNTGATQAPVTELAASAPSGWTVTPAATRVDPLAPGESATIPLTVTAPAGAEAGRHEVAFALRTGRMATTVRHPLTVNLPNLSLGRPATQKSTGYDAPAGRAVDGNTDGAFFGGSVTHTAEPERQAWWQVDLGESAALSGVDIWNRTDCCGDRLKDFWVLASDQPITADGLEEARSAPGVTAVHVAAQAGRPSRIALPEGTRGRYVRVQLASTNNPLSLAEVQVRGRISN
ncbi:alpha-L-fucosidase [Nonomuraea africana]|uniref:alpha-L-fucosidase n=1 Tax=Nonomuraea africana TaxID=46171 RepID=A0ABR9KLI3_9ACTN|nr:alpha-L-fucosidase [Nonomuraea africana]MBE1562840.1 alpha-L-fucosidase [Nonomuraea africana]